jgi:predicted dehydrogenase
MPSIQRRDFLRLSASASGLLALAALDNLLLADEKKIGEPAGPSSRNDALRVAVIGVNGRGMDHIGGFAGSKKLNTVVTHICDADEGVIGKAMKTIEDKQKMAPKYEQDIRKLLDDKSIDVVSIATPNHWHALAAIWAMQAGKDVYVEKPVSHNVKEGRMIVEFAEKLGKICQTGTQSRSAKGMQDAMNYIHSGKIGTVRLSRGLCYKPRGSIGKVDKATPIAKTCDYNLWCGPAPMSPLMRKKLHYDWHWVWETGNGDLGNQGIHEMDKARWGLGKMEMPKSVVSVGGRLGYEDDGQTANTQLCFFDYGDAELIFEVRGLKTGDYRGAKVGNVFYGSEGYVVCPSYSNGVAYDKDGNVVQKFSGGGDHYENFVKAVRARDAKLLNAPILQGHLSSALCHLGNISYRLGNVSSEAELAEFFTDGKNPLGLGESACETFGRLKEHLSDNAVKPEGGFRTGRKLTIDPKTESFANDTSANQMLFREYRKGFEVPEKV